MKHFITIVALAFIIIFAASCSSPYYGVPRSPNYYKEQPRYYKVKGPRNVYPNRPKKFAVQEMKWDNNKA